MSNVKVRFAPSPTGNLHVGNLRTALVNYLFAHSRGGHFMLRIDDTDTERSTAAFEASIRTDLEWMGMHQDSEDRQSERLGQYDAALQRLLTDGRAYACYETPEELALKRKADGRLREAAAEWGPLTADVPMSKGPARSPSPRPAGPEAVRSVTVPTNRLHSNNGFEHYRCNQMP